MPTAVPSAVRAPRFPSLLCAEAIEKKELSWMWYPYIPYGAASMIFGAGGMGKSWISCEIAAAVTTGRLLPGQTGGLREPRSVLILSAEDDVSYVLRPRLEATGADLSRVYLPETSFVLDGPALRGLEKAVREVSAAVVFIDPIVAYMGGKIDMNKMNEVRTITGALHGIAQRTHTAIIVVHHSRKGSEGVSYEKAAGSGDFVNAVRSVMFVSMLDQTTRGFEHVKSNYARYGKGLTYTVDEDSGFRWVGEMVDGAGGPPLTASGKKRDEARAFLKAILANGPVRSTEVISAGKDEGFTFATLHRAKLGVVESILRYEGEDRQWYWRIIGDKREPLGASEHPGEDPEGEAEDWLRKRRLV